MKNYFNKFLLTTILTFVANISFTQTVTIGPVQNIAYGFSGVLPVSENSFFVTHSDKMSGTKLILTHYSNFVEDATTGTITSNDCGVLVIDSKLVVFRTDKKSGIETMSAQEYGADCKPVGGTKTLMSYKIVSPTIPKENVSGSVVQSENGEYFAVIFRVEHKGKLQFGFNIYDKSFKTIREGFFDCPYEDHELRYPDEYLSNQGNLYFTCFKGVKKIWKLENNTLNELTLAFDGFTIVNPVLFETEDGVIKSVGVGYETGSTDLELLISTLNFEDKKAILETKIELTKEFIGFNDLPSTYSIPNIVTYKNGNTAFVIDQYGTFTKTSSSNGVISYDQFTTYYDTKVLMLDENQEIFWTANLGHANQISYYGEYESTFCLDSKDDELIFYMNLNKTRSGKEIPNTFTVSSDHRAADDNCLGRISVDIETGETKRKLLCDEVDCNWGSYLTLDKYNKGVIATYSKGLIKYRFGLVK